MVRRFLSLFLLLHLATACAGTVPVNETPVSAVSPDADNSCSYFYFLWGNHAEYDQRFEEALEAYEKALICDPHALPIQKKIPVLLVKLGQTEKATKWIEEYIVNHPEDTSQHLLLAHLYIQQKKREEAIKLYYEVLEDEPENEGIFLRLGILHTQQQQFDEAERIFSTIIADNPEHYLAHIYLARLQLMNDKSDRAIELYEQALALNWSPELVYETVELYIDQHLYERALALYTTILDNNPKAGRAALGRVQLLLSMGRDEQALKELNSFKIHSEHHPPLDMAIAKLYIRMDRIEEGRSLLMELRSEDETRSEALYLLGLIAYQSGNNQGALSYLSRIPAGSDDYAEGIYLQVRILRHEGDTEKAIDLLISSTGNPKTDHPLFYALLSSLLQEQGEYEASLDTLSRGNTAFPDNELLLYEQALLLEKSGNRSQAMTIMHRVLELKPDHAEALNFIGYSWADKNINLDKAYEYIKKAVELEPESGYIRDSLGWVLFRLGKLESALEELVRALELEPGDAHIYDHLGDVYRALQKYSEAREAYLKAAEMFDDDQKRAAIKEKLNALPTP